MLEPIKHNRFEKKKILLIDDDNMILDSITNILEREKDKYEVIKTGNSLSVNQLVIEHKPDLVILDIMLSWIDGIALAKTIKKIHKKAKIMAISGYYDEIQNKRILEVGADAFLAKPFELHEFMENVEILLEREV